VALSGPEETDAEVVIATDVTGHTRSRPLVRLDKECQ
jgi:hypothetical protein